MQKWADFCSVVLLPATVCDAYHDRFPFPDNTQTRLLDLVDLTLRQFQTTKASLRSGTVALVDIQSCFVVWARLKFLLTPRSRDPGIQRNSKRQKKLGSYSHNRSSLSKADDRGKAAIHIISTSSDKDPCWAPCLVSRMVSAKR